MTKVEDHDIATWEGEGGNPGAVRTEARPFEKAVFDALVFTGDQVKKVDVSIGPRSQTVTFKFSLTGEQVTQLDAMANTR